MTRVLLALALVGCAKSVVPEFEARRAAVLSPQTVIPRDWSPDAILTIDRAMLSDIVRQALHSAGTFEKRIALGGANTFVRPALTIDRLDLAASPTCGACLRVDTDLSGDISWQIARASGSSDLGGAMVFDAVLDVERSGDDFVVTLTPRDVISADLQIGGRVIRQVRTFAEGSLQHWSREQIFEQAPPIRVTRFDAGDLPLRAARVLPHGAGLRVDLLTRAAIIETVALNSTTPSEGWSLVLSQQALLHVARVQAFEHGAVAHDVVAEPTALTLNDEGFELGLRLWRPVGRGWWRDLNITGTHALTTQGFRFTATEATEVARSNGARLIDPLAALAEGRILTAVERAITTSLPGGHEGQIAGAPVNLDIETMQASGGTVRLGGSATVARPDPRRARQGSR